VTVDTWELKLKWAPVGNLVLFTLPEFYHWYI